MREERGKSAFQVYKRLLPKLLRYKTRVVIGVVAGILAGGTIFTILQLGDQVLARFDGRRPAKVEKADKAAAVKVSKVEKKTQALEDVAQKLGIKATTEDGRMTLAFFLLAAIGLPLVAFLRAFAIYLNRYHMRWVASRVTRDLRDELFERLGEQSLSFFGKSDVGQLISSCTNDAAVVERVLTTTVSHVTRAPVEILAALTFVVLYCLENELLGLVVGVALVFPLVIFPIIVLGRMVRRHMRKALDGISVLVSRMHENFTGIKVVKAFDMGEKETSRFKAMNREYFKSVVAALKAQLLMTPLMEAVAILMGLIFLSMCYVRDVTLSKIMLVGLGAVIAYRPLKQLAGINADLQRGAAALERIFEMLSIDTALKEAESPVAHPEFTDKIVFDSVSFRYEPEGDMTVSDVCLEIPRGHIIAVVGETGSGKTTLANLLGRFYDPTEGSVAMDGIDLRDMKMSDLRKLVGVVTQETILFNDTIAGNIAYGTEDASEDAIIEAAKKANAHEFIMGEPDGYKRMAGEKGFVLSGGEKQRIAIARAILKNPPILILDEATSALDTVTERLVQEAINRVMENRTVFAIAHRLSTIKHANEILLLDKGRIIERGTHDELYAAGGRYRGLCDMQVLDS